MMVNVTVVLCVFAPPVPVIVRVNVPCALRTETVNVDVPVGTTELGLNVAVAPGGSPLTERFTGALKPPIEVTVTV